MNYQVTWFDQDGTPYRFTFADKDAAWMKYEEGKFYGNIRKVRMERLKAGAKPVAQTGIGGASSMESTAA